MGKEDEEDQIEGGVWKVVVIKRGKSKFKDERFGTVMQLCQSWSE